VVDPTAKRRQIGFVFSQPSADYIPITLFYTDSYSYLAFSKLALFFQITIYAIRTTQYEIGFVFSPPETGYIRVILSHKYAYAHPAHRQLGLFFRNISPKCHKVVYNFSKMLRWATCAL
jgi:hypothetical protein